MELRVTGAYGDSEAYSSPKTGKAPSNILNKKFSCVKSNSAIFKIVNADYVMSYPNNVTQFGLWWH